MPGAGRRSHQILVASVADAGLRPASAASPPVAQALEHLRQPERGRSPKMIGRNALMPVSRPSQNGEDDAQRQQVRQEVGGLAHQVDAQVVVLDAGMDVHAADRHAPGEGLMLLARGCGSAPVDRRLLGPVAQGWVEAAIIRMPNSRAHAATVLRRCASSCVGLVDRAADRRCRPRPATAGTRASPEAPSASSQRCMKPAAAGSRAPASRDRRAGIPPRCPGSKPAWVMPWRLPPRFLLGPRPGSPACPGSRLVF